MEKWLYYSLVALVLVCGVDLGRKYILDKGMIDPDSMVVYISIILGVFATIHFFMDKNCQNPLKCKPKVILYLILVSFFIYFFNLTFTRSMNLAKEVTLPVIIISLSAIFIYLVSSLFFEKSPKFNVNIFIGVLLTVVGLGMVTKYM